MARFYVVLLSAYHKTFWLTKKEECKSKKHPSLAYHLQKQTHRCTHARMHARTHTHTHTHTHTQPASRFHCCWSRWSVCVCVCVCVWLWCVFWFNVHESCCYEYKWKATVNRLTPRTSSIWLHQLTQSWLLTKKLKAPWENVQSLDKTHPKMPHKHICAQKNICNIFLQNQGYFFRHARSLSLTHTHTHAHTHAHTHTHTHTHTERPPWTSCVGMTRWIQSIPLGLSNTQSTTITPHGINAHTCASKFTYFPSSRFDWQHFLSQVLSDDGDPTISVPRYERICTQSSNQTIWLSYHSVALIFSRCQKNTQ